MAEFNFTDLNSAASLLTTGLDSLANGSGAISSAQDNTGGELYGAFELYLASVDLSAQTNPAVYVYYAWEVDGSNYEDGGAAVEPQKMADVIIPLREVSGAQRVIVPAIIPTGSWKVLAFNHSGAALASSGNTLKVATFSTESN